MLKLTRAMVWKALQKLRGAVSDYVSGSGGGKHGRIVKAVAEGYDIGERDTEQPAETAQAVALVGGVEVQPLSSG